MRACQPVVPSSPLPPFLQHDDGGKGGRGEVRRQCLGLRKSGAKWAPGASGLPEAGRSTPNRAVRQIDGGVSRSGVVRPGPLWSKKSSVFPLSPHPPFLIAFMGGKGEGGISRTNRPVVGPPTDGGGMPRTGHCRFSSVNLHVK